MPARPDAGAMVLLQSVDGDGFCVYRMVGRTIAGIARYPQPVSSLGHGADRQRGACAQYGIARDGGRDNAGAPVRSLPGLLDAATRWRPVAPELASAPRDNGGDRAQTAGAHPE